MYAINHGGGWGGTSKDIRSRLKISTTISRIAVRETGVSRHHGGPVEDILKPFKHHSNMVCGGLRGVFNCAPIIPRIINFLDGRLKKFHFDFVSVTCHFSIEFVRSFRGTFRLKLCELFELFSTDSIRTFRCRFWLYLLMMMIAPNSRARKGGVEKMGEVKG